jgi:dolichyl-phosphate beta-glucosyltransferase
VFNKSLEEDMRLWVSNDENTFIDSRTSEVRRFGDLTIDNGQGTVDLSVIIPSYNEQERLPLMLDDALKELIEKQEQDPSFSFELLIVDDGSKDKTSETAFSYAKKSGNDTIRVLKLLKNRGKGGAVRRVNLLFGW